VSLRGITVQNGRNSASSVRAVGSTADYGRLLNVDFDAGRFFTETESDSGSAVAILGNDLAKLLFPGKPALGGTILVRGHPFLVIGVLAHQGAFLGLFSFDNQILLPLTAFHKYVSNQDWNGELQVKIKDQNRRPEAAEELIGAMRRVRAQLPGERDNFSVNQQDVFKEQLDPARRAIGIAGLIVTGLALFVGAIGIMNITFVSVMERTREIGTRKALGARRRTILTQFLVESASVALVGGFVGVGATWLLVIVLRHAMPSLPLQVSPLLILIGLGLSTATGILAGFVPAVGASRLDPVDALRYE
jgi:putative ABC transport system permease protein